MNRKPGHINTAKILRQVKLKAHALIKKELGVMLKQAKGTVPVDTGFTRDNMIIDEQKLGGRVITQNLESRFIEYGGFRNAPKPFMRNAFLDNVIPSSDRITKGLAKEIKSINGRQ